MGGKAEDHAGFEERASGRRREIVLAEVNTVRVDRDREVDAIVHDERHARGAAARAQPLRQGKERTRGARLLAQLDHLGAAVERAREDGVEIAPARDRAVEDDVEAGRRHFRRSGASALVKRPSMNAGCASTRCRNGIVVLTPSTTVSPSARRIRASASARSSPRTMIFAISES